MSAEHGDAERFMQLAIDAAAESMRQGFGGPFGACIVHDGELIAVGVNTVLRDNDPTAHAEINVIRAAAGKLGTYWLDDCTMFCTCEPCPMCLGAIYWARIREVHFGCDRRQAEAVGFADSFVYDDLVKDLTERSITFHSGLLIEPCRKLMHAWTTLPNKTPY